MNPPVRLEGTHLRPHLRPHLCRLDFLIGCPKLWKPGFPSQLPRMGVWSLWHIFKGSQEDTLFEQLSLLQGDAREKAPALRYWDIGPRPVSATLSLQDPVEMFTLWASALYSSKETETPIAKDSHEDYRGIEWRYIPTMSSIGPGLWQMLSNWDLLLRLQE